jgi:two-component system, OmpR family, sensor histidine kinase MprB
MSLRRRISLLSAVTVAIAVTLACVAAYVAVRAELRSEVDDALSGQAAFVAARFTQPLGSGATVPAPPPRRGGPIAYGQIVIGGDVVRPLGAPLKLPVGARVKALSDQGSGRFFTDAEVGGAHLRVLAVGTEDGALQLARSLDGADAVLARLRWVLIGVCLAGVALAALLGRMLGRRVAEPIRDVAATAHHISQTEDLGRRIDSRRTDEIGELAAEFDAMLAALERSVDAQRRLVADASHELRTPVTTLRANIELLDEHGGALSGEERGALVADLRGQVEELGALVADIIELARGAEPAGASEDVRLDELVAASVARARVHAPATRFVLDREPALVAGVPDRLGRAVNNLLDNAAQHGGGVVDVRVGEAGVVVRDRGPGISDEDLDHVFDRFYRCADARGRPGTGLGLAIVRQVAETHGGSVRAVNAPGGGAELTLALPASRLSGTLARR